MMTGNAIQLRVLGHIGLHLPVRLGMAYITTLLQTPVGVQFHGGMRIVTSGARFQDRAVGLPVTGVTLRQDVLISRLSRAIVVIRFVTLLTRYLMFSALFPQKVIVMRMTPPALLCRQRFDFHVVGRSNFAGLGRHR
jgi:hypothetical protein